MNVYNSYIFFLKIQTEEADGYKEMKNREKEEEMVIKGESKQIETVNCNYGVC